MVWGRRYRAAQRCGFGRLVLAGWFCARWGLVLVRGQPEPAQRLRHGLGAGSRWQRWALDQQHRQAQSARGQQLGPATVAARVFGHHPLDAVGAQQRQIAIVAVGAALHHHGAARRRYLESGLDDAQQIPMRGALQERLDVLAPDGQKDAARLGWQRAHGGLEVGHAVPAIAGFGTPRRALQRQQRHAGLRASLDGVAAHLRGKGVGGVDHMRDALLAQIVGQSLRSAEAAHAGRQRLGDRLRRASGIRKDRRHARARQRLRQLGGFGGAPKQEDVHGG